MCGNTQLMQSRILVFGSQGQVATSLQKSLPSNSLFLSQEQADLEKSDEILKAISVHQPTHIFCPAAYTMVDQAESEPEKCFQVNSVATGLIANKCAELKIPFVWYSTDYVFDGHGDQPFQEQDAKNPLNIYGQSKAEGEKKIQESGCDYFIFRTSWVISPFGKNFVKTMLQLGAQREELKIVSDQIGSPTSAQDLAVASWTALQKAEQQRIDTLRFPSGIYHLTNAGFTSWAGLAEKIFALAASRKLDLKIKKTIPISTADYPTAAKRPKNSRLSNQKFINTFGFQMRVWDQALEQIIAQH